jgi:hypothetical protein
MGPIVYSNSTNGSPGNILTDWDTHELNTCCTSMYTSPWNGNGRMRYRNIIRMECVAEWLPLQQIIVPPLHLQWHRMALSHMALKVWLLKLSTIWQWFVLHFQCYNYQHPMTTLIFMNKILGIIMGIHRSNTLHLHNYVILLCSFMLKHPAIRNWWHFIFRSVHLKMYAPDRCCGIKLSCSPQAWYQ